jgi:hypothetical protein
MIRAVLTADDRNEWNDISLSCRVQGLHLYRCIKPLKAMINPKSRDSVRTAQYTHSIPVITTNHLMLYRLFVYATTHCSLKAYCAILVRRSNFRHQASPRVSPREITRWRKVELWARNVPVILPKCRLTVTFRDLSHAVKLRHGTDGFTSLPKEGVLRIFSP